MNHGVEVQPIPLNAYKLFKLYEIEIQLMMIKTLVI